MAEPVGILFGVASLVFQIYTKCQNSPVDFLRLDQDLKLFHEALLLSEPYLPHLETVRIACKELDAEIEALLIENKSRNPWKRVKLSFKEIQPLRARLHYMISTLHLDVSILNHRDFKPNQQAETKYRQLKQERSVNAEDETKTTDDVSHLDIQDLSFDYTKSILFEHGSYPSSVHEAIAHAPSSIVSTVSSTSDGTARDRLSLQSSISISSASTAGTNFSAPLTRLESKERCLRPGIAAAARQDNCAILKDIWSSRSFPAANDLLIKISKTTEQLPIHAAQISALSRQGALVDYRDSEYLRTPLIWAIISGRNDLVEILLQHQASSNIRDGRWHRTPATWAVMEDQPAILGILIKAGADLTATDDKSGYTALLWAASSGNTCAAEVILENNRDLIKVTDKDGMTPLAISYFENYLDTAQLFVKYGDNPSYKDKYGASLLAWAIRSKQTAFSTVLIQHGADTRSTHMDGTPVLILAMQQDLTDVAELLIRNNADVQCIDANSVPALTLAVKGQHEGVVKMLIEMQVDLEAKDGDNNTALLWAVWGNDENMVELLLKNKANTYAMDGQQDFTIREWAEKMGNEEIIRLLSVIS